MTTLGSSTNASFLGVWLFSCSDGATWLGSGGSPDSIELSGLTQGLSYLKLWRLLSQVEVETLVFDVWQVGNGVKNYSTYGDDNISGIYAHKIPGDLPTQNTEKAYFKRFGKTHNRGTADNVYLFNRFATSANGYETFYTDAFSAMKYQHVLVRDIQLTWNEQTNYKTVARLTVEEVWKSSD
jgi:hypothetical protein